MLYHNVMWKFCDAEGKTLDENIEIVNDLNAYKVHPEHQKVASYVKKVTSGRAAVDYYK